MPDGYSFTLTQEEYDLLLLAVGYATGAAMREENGHLAQSFLSLANAINRNNPNWTPYEVGIERQLKERE